MTRRNVLPDAILARITETPDGCWIFDGSDNGRGYKTISHDYAHRHMYRIYVAPIPDGYEIDHLCRVRACVNPAHLDAVTPAENMRRAFSAKTECKNGHPLPTFDGKRRECRRCHADRQAKVRQQVRDGVRQVTVHNLTGYMSGCRCDTCREASRARDKRRRADVERLIQHAA